MRRLLVFGTGAAIIGTVLLITAFYETYVIVDHLQNGLNAAVESTSNNLLEDSSIEAVFLGIMAALGYVLIAQGLEGIRKQELVDLQRGSETMAPPRQKSKLGSGQVEGEKPRGWRSIPSPEVGVAKTSSTSETKQPATQGSESSRPFLFSSASQTSSKTASTASTSAEPVTGQAVAEPSTLGAEEPQKTEGPDSYVNAEAETPQSSFDQATPETPSTVESSGSGVAWEGGPPPALEGVEVLKEPAVYGGWMGTSSQYSGVHPRVSEPVQSSGDQSVPGSPEVGPIKRRRGRPKGARKKKVEDQPGSTETPSQAPPESSGESSPETSAPPSP